MPGAFAPRREAIAPPVDFGPERNQSLRFSMKPVPKSGGMKALPAASLETFTGRSVKKSFRLPKKLCVIACFFHSNPGVNSPAGRFTDSDFGAFGSRFGVSLSILLSQIPAAIMRYFLRYIRDGIVVCSLTGLTAVPSIIP